LSPSVRTSSSSASSLCSDFKALDLGDAFAGFNVIIADLKIGKSCSNASGSNSRPEAFFVTNRPPRAVLVGREGLESLIDEAVTSAAEAEGAAAEEGRTGEATKRPRDEMFCHLKGSMVVARRIEDGAHALSNSTINDDRWAKVHFMRDALARLRGEAGSDEWHVHASGSEASATATPLSEDVELLKRLMARMVPIVTHCTPLDSATRMPDLSWSIIPEGLERHLQDSVFVKPFEGVEYGTRAVNVTCRIRDTVFFLYRTYDKKEEEEHARVALALAEGAEPVEVKKRREESSATQEVLQALSAAAPVPSVATVSAGATGSPADAGISISPSDAALAPATPAASGSGSHEVTREGRGDAADGKRLSRTADREFGDFKMRFGDDPEEWLVCWDRAR
jgi:hypothetical protein